MLGEFLSCMLMLEALPTAERMTELLSAAFRTVPGVRSCEVRLGTAELRGQASDQASSPGRWVIPVETVEHAYGVFLLEAEDEELLVPYRPLFANLASHVALLSENRWQRDRLEGALQELSESTEQLEVRVSGRTAELQQANEQLLVELAERKRVEAELRKLTRMLRTLSQSNQLLLHATEEADLLQDVCGMTVEMAGYRMAWVGFVEHDAEKTLRPVAWAGTGADYHEHIQVSWGTGPTGQGPGGRCIRERRPVAVRDIMHDPSFAPWRAEATRRGYQSMIALPLVGSRDEVFGALGIYAEEADAFDAEETTLLSESAGDLAFGIEALRERQRRAEAEERAGEAARYARSLIEVNLNPLVTISSEGEITDVNKATEEATGLPREQLIGTDFADYFTEPEKARAGYRRVLEEGLVRDYPLVLRNASGTLMDVEYNAIVYRDEAGELQGVFAAARDVTEAKKAQEQVARLAAIVTSSQDAIFSKDLDGTLTTWNAAAEALYGYSAEEAIGRSVEILMPPGRAGEAQEITARVLRGDRVSGHETQRMCKDGSLVDVRLTMSPIHDPAGDIVAISVIGNDVSARLHAECMLRQSEEKFSAAFRASPDLIAVTRLSDGEILEVNEAYSRLLGYTRTESLGTTTSALSIWADPADRATFVASLEESGQIDEFETTLRRKDGTLLTCVDSARTIEFQGETCVLSVVRDITERRQAEEALRENESRFRSLFEDSPIAMWEEDHSAVKVRLEQLLANGVEDIVAYLRSHPDEYRRCIQLARPLNVNRAAVKLFAASDKQELLERADELHRPERLGSLCQFWEAMMAGERLASYEETNVTLAGKCIELLETCTLAPGCEGSWARVYIDDADITERKQAEEALGRANRELQAISNCNQTLLRAGDEQTLLEDICRIVCDEAGYRMAWVGYAQSDGAKTVRPMASAGVDEASLAAAGAFWSDATSERSPAGVAIRGGESVCIADVTTDPRAAPWRESAQQIGYRSSIAVPLTDKNAFTLGVLSICSSEPGAFTADEVRLLEELAGDLAFGITVLRARTELMRAEEQRRAHVALLEGMERIDQAIRQDTDVERMLQSVVEAVFSLFDCDRAWLFYPCDPDAPSFRVPVEVSRPEYPGANALDQEVPMDPSLANDLRAALESEGPLSYANGTDRPVNTLSAEQFGVQAQMMQAIYPRVGKPWVFGMHQCSHARIWTEDEEERFKEIGRRVADGLSTLLFLRDLQASEERVSTAAAEWRATFDAMSDSVALFDAEGRVLRCNAATSALTGRGYKEIVGRPCHEVFHGSAEWHATCPQLAARESLKSETVVFEQDGRWLRVSFQPQRDAEGGFAGGVHVVSDISALKEAELQSRRSLGQLQAVTEEVIAAIADIVEARDPYTAGHERRVSGLAQAIAIHMGLGEERVAGVRVAALLHDVGKITVPTEILSKPGRLSELEFQLIKTHPQASHDVLVGIEFPWPVAEAALQHHERLDGSGYPRGLAGEEIMPEARILAVADVVEAMASHRPYRPALGSDAALAEIERHSGSLYDAEVVAACVALFREDGFAFD